MTFAPLLENYTPLCVCTNFVSNTSAKVLVVIQGENRKIVQCKQRLIQKPCGLHSVLSLAEGRGVPRGVSWLPGNPSAPKD